MRFNDRLDAASQLIPYLKKYKGDKSVVLAVPRGGVPMGCLIAKHFHFPVELLMSKKIGHPANPEFAIGAVNLEDHIVDESEGIEESYIADKVRSIRKSLSDRYKRFMGEDHKPLSLEDKTVIIIDDGIATGHTILSSISMLRRQNPKKIVVAVPVAPPSTARKVKQIVDDFICLYMPDDFTGVGYHYADFSEVTDDEVIRLLKEMNPS